MKDRPIGEVEELKQSEIYNPQDSSNIQTTKLPADINYEKLDCDLAEWRYFYQDEASPFQGEILIPTQGYAMGGSRQDERYHDKLFKNEDCSSAIAKWSEAEDTFDTGTMEKLYDGCYVDTPYYRACKEVLTPKEDGFEVGDIYAFRKYDIKNNPNKDDYSYSKGGHTGVVSNIIDENIFEGLSYSRMMNNKEGLGYDLYDLNSANKRFFFFEYSGEKLQDYSFDDYLEELPPALDSFPSEYIF